MILFPIAIRFLAANANFADHSSSSFACLLASSSCRFDNLYCPTFAVTPQIPKPNATKPKSVLMIFQRSMARLAFPNPFYKADNSYHPRARCGQTEHNRQEVGEA